MKSKLNKHAAFLAYCTPDDNGIYPCYVDVAKQFGVSEKWIEVIGTKYKWVLNRDIKQREEVERAFKDRAELITITEKKHYKQLEVMESVIMDSISDSIAAQKVVNEPEKKNDSDYKKKKRKAAFKRLRNSAYDLDKLSTALTNIQMAKRVTLGIPTQVTKGSLDHNVRGAALSDEQIAAMDAFLEKNTK